MFDLWKSHKNRKKAVSKSSAFPRLPYPGNSAHDLYAVSEINLLAHNDSESSSKAMSVFTSAADDHATVSRKCCNDLVERWLRS